MGSRVVDVHLDCELVNLWVVDLADDGLCHLLVVLLLFLLDVQAEDLVLKGLVKVEVL